MSLREGCRVTFRGCMKLPGCKFVCFRCLLPVCYSCSDSDDEADSDNDDGTVRSNRTGADKSSDSNHNSQRLTSIENSLSHDLCLPLEYYNDPQMHETTIYRDQKHVYVNDEADATYRDSNFRSPNFDAQFENLSYAMTFDPEVKDKEKNEEHVNGKNPLQEFSVRYVKETSLHKENRSLKENCSQQENLYLEISQGVPSQPQVRVEEDSEETDDMGNPNILRTCDSNSSDEEETVSVDENKPQKRTLVLLESHL